MRRHPLPVAPDLLNQTFAATRPDTVWLADITSIASGEGWLYPAAVLDLATREILGWSMRDNMRTEPPLAAPMMAVQRQRLPESRLPFRSRKPIRIGGIWQATRRDEGEALDEPNRVLLR